MADYTFDTPFIYDVNSIITANVTFIGKSGGSAKIEAGTLVGMITASKKYQVYATANDDGTGVAVGILITDIPALAENAIATGTIAIGGSLVKENLTGYDADAKTDLGAREVVMDANKTLVIF